MLKRRLVTTVLADQSQSDAARAYGVTQGWISKLLARYRAEGQAAFEPRSRAPKTSPAATPAETVELVLTLRKQLAETGHDAGAETICWHLAQHHDVRAPRGPRGELRFAKGRSLAVLKETLVTVGLEESEDLPA